MKQLIQNLKTGETLLEEVPVPQVRPGHVLIQTRRSLVSLGTERMLVEFGRSSLIAKARQQPERVKQVWEKIQADGLMPTLEAVFRKLDQPLPLGYCNVGTVLALGEGITDLRIGDRVASNGQHAEVVCIPRNLVALIPDSVSDDEAAFTVMGAIGLNGIRLLDPKLGDTVVVIGLGLLGLLTAHLLRLNGCRVIGIDIDEQKCQLARHGNIQTLNPSAGADSVNAVLAFTNGIGADGVLITASSQTDEIMSQAARMSRQRGKVILLGVVGLQLVRDEFYKKELTFQVACSYGPGRYDDSYEQQGHDYPLAYVRWTANRNFQAILHLLASGQLDVKPFITEVVPFSEFHQIYNNLSAPHRIASLLTYPESTDYQLTIQIKFRDYSWSAGTVGIIGAGNFTDAILLPALKRAGANLKTIASAGGLNATLLAKKHGIAQCTTDYQNILQDPEIDLCVITTRHNNHAQLTIEALQAGKHVFVEKPLAIYNHELPLLIQAQQVSGRLVMVGFNRRFSPYTQKMKDLLRALTGSQMVPINVVATINAGSIPANSWVHNRDIGGGRILGEACHWVDLITFLTDSLVARVCMNALGPNPSETADSVSLLLHYENGSTGVVNYFSNGSKAYSKERIEVYALERTLVLDNFRQLTGYGFRGFSKLSGKQDKGHTEQMRLLIQRVHQGGKPLIPFSELINTTQTMLAALQSMRERRWVDVASIDLPQNTPLVEQEEC
jgi:predicted dehydrogenase/threonine dehydrogenase-like Zn-dependent dehydrogenase